MRAGAAAPPADVAPAVVLPDGVAPPHSPASAGSLPGLSSAASASSADTPPAGTPAAAGAAPGDLSGGDGPPHPSEHRPCAAGRRHDFGPGLATCADCGAYPLLNRGCGRCGVRLCRRCFAEHRQRGREPLRTDFEVLRPLGRGAQAEVLLVRRRAGGGLLALKVAEKAETLRGRRAAEARAERDVMAAASARSPFLLTLHAAFQSATRLFVVVDHMPGGDLHAYVGRRGALGDAAGRRAMAQVLAGLLALHDAGFVHRDVKPENVLLDARGNCCVADFGVARPAADRGRRVAGTDAYLAPELLQSGGGAPQCAATDLWAYGCVVVHALTGHDPFPGLPPPGQLHSAILSRAPLLRGAEGSGARGLILGLLEKDQARRLSGDAAQRHEWLAGAGPLTEGGMPGWAPPPGPPPPRRARALTESRHEPRGAAAEDLPNWLSGYELPWRERREAGQAVPAA